MRVRLKADNSTKIAPSFYYHYAIPGSTGARLPRGHRRL